MTKILETPDFKSEEEEATWWDNNQNLMLNVLKQAAKDGTLGRGTLAKRGLTSKTTIRLDDSDLELAKKLAHKRGLRYQTYLKSLIHQALVSEAASSNSKP